MLRYTKKILTCTPSTAPFPKAFVHTYSGYACGQHVPAVGEHFHASFRAVFVDFRKFPIQHSSRCVDSWTGPEHSGVCLTSIWLRFSRHSCETAHPDRERPDRRTDVQTEMQRQIEKWCDIEQKIENERERDRERERERDGE